MFSIRQPCGCQATKTGCTQPLTHCQLGLIPAPDDLKEGYAVQEMVRSLWIHTLQNCYIHVFGLLAITLTLYKKSHGV